MVDYYQLDAFHIKDMVDYPQTFSTLNETEVRLINPALLQVGIPNFPQGEGSLARVNLRYNVSQSPTIYPEYTAYITYDQGSSKIFIGKPLSLSDVIFNFWNTDWIPIVTIAVGIYILFSILNLRKGGIQPIKDPLFLLIGWWAQKSLLGIGASVSNIISSFAIKIKRHQYKDARQILEDIFELQKLNISFYDDPLDIAIENWDRTQGGTKRRILGYDMKSYNLVDNFFSLFRRT
jgi:hypothetical protein